METNLREILRFAGLGALALFVMAGMSGCATAILSSNLSRYPNGVQVDQVGSNIPGSPAGDFVSNVAPLAVVTAGGTTLINGNKLHVEGGHVSYRPAEHVVPNRYQVVWRGLRDNHATGNTHIRLQDSSGRNAVVLRFERNRLTAPNAPDAEGTFATDRTHDVSIIIFMQGASKMVRVFITEQGTATPIFDSPPLELMDNAFSRLDVVQFESDSDVSYFMQDLRVLVD